MNSIMIMADDELHKTAGYGFEVSDFFELSDWIEKDDHGSPATFLQPCAVSFPGPGGAPNLNYGPSNAVVFDQLAGSSSMHGGSFSGESGKEEKKVMEKVAFKTKSEVEILDDGFKWKKYGKKMVKESPNPRNYYRCSIEGCPVKKRVERDRDDSRYVVTTYEGIHNHIGLQL